MLPIKNVIVFIVLFYHMPLQINGGRTSRWDECECRFLEWQSWQSCSKECNGQRRRMRQVNHSKRCDIDFSGCATDDMGWDYSRCNRFCYNGGTSDGYSCDCVTGFYGSCCGHQKTCGHPGSILNGRVHGTRYTYDSTIYYSCNSNYKLVEGSSSRRCTLYEYWSGTRPRCAYFNSCSSGPCKNQATCTNMPDDYKCSCAGGWTGRNCETDIYPPVVSHCSGNINVKTENLTRTVTWNKPEFTDPHGLFDVVVTSNYLTNHFTFPWGDFVISYSAVKPSNGLKSECTFEIKVRPHSCPALDIPENGAVVCNNWKTDYGQLCFIFCKEFYTVARGINPNDWFICGAAGSWISSSSLPDCTVQFLRLPKMNGYQVANMYSNDCTENDRDIRRHYITNLKQSDFKYFCKKYQNECKEENVSVRC